MFQSPADQKIAGVCGAFGEFTPIPAWIWRALFFGLVLCGGIGLLVYLSFWICMPSRRRL